MPPDRRAAARSALLALVFAAAAAPAQAGDVRGRLELTGLGSFNNPTSLDASLGTKDYVDGIGNLRLMWAPRWDNWDFTVHYVLSGEVGKGVPLAGAEAALSPVPPPATLFDLTGTVIDGGDLQLTQSIDRLALGYSADNFVVRAGRQALTWGAGLVFHPMDLVDPFAPNTVDTEYKPGVDMLYGQYLFDNGADLQAIAVPRAATAGGPVTWNASTFALRYGGELGDLGLEAILSRDHGDVTLGLGLSGALGAAAWNAEIVPTIEPDGTVRVSGLANISTGTTLLDRNATLFAEYYHNGFGVTGSGTALDMLPADLVDRLSRGQAFTTSADYLAAGLSMEWTPLLTVSPSAIVDLSDFSVDLAAEANWSLGDNTNLIIGGQLPLGNLGSEFGGRPLTGTSAPYATPAATAYVQLRQYF